MSNNVVISTIFSKENSWRSDALDLLARFAQLAAGNAIRHRCSLARMRRGMGGACCRPVLYGALIAAIVTAVSSALASIWLCLYQAGGVKILYPTTLVCVHLGLGSAGFAIFWGKGRV